MRIAVSFRILGVLLMLFSSAMVAPLVLALLAGEDSADAFLLAFAISFTSGLILWAPVRNTRQELRIRDGFLITSLFWTVLGTFGALPLLLSEGQQLSWTEALFESISRLTTTGATVMTELDYAPTSILFYRQLLQWLGGIGIIVIAVAVLPMLGIGGMQLYRAESPGPSKDAKLAPRIAETAKALASVYVVLTIACALAYYFAGMSVFDALGHAFSTVAIGGFSTHDQSMGYFDGEAVLVVCSIFMLISAINFGLHFTAWRQISQPARRRRRLLGVYLGDPETRFFLSVIAIGTAITAGYLLFSATLTPYNSLVHGVFQTISIATTTGFTTRDFSVWPAFLPVMLLMLAFMGGCVGSTGGGMKAMRVMLIYKQGVRELKQLVHPDAVIPLKVGKTRVKASVVSAVWSFFAVYTTSFIVIMLLLMATGLDFLTAFSAVAATINNLGPGLGAVTANYSNISEAAKLLLCFAMLLGRLEVFTLLVLFTPAFWRV